MKWAALIALMAVSMMVQPLTLVFLMNMVRSEWLTSIPALDYPSAAWIWLAVVVTTIVSSVFVSVARALMGEDS